MSNLKLLPRHGERITLRRLSLLDLQAFQAYRHDPEVGLYQGWSPLSDEEASTFICEMRDAELFAVGEWFQLGIADKHTDLLIGDVGVFISEDGMESQIGYTLSRPSQGVGLATEAVKETVLFIFENTRVSRIIGITDVLNQASIRLLERIGMKEIEITDTLFRGEPCREITYALCRGRFSNL